MHPVYSNSSENLALLARFQNILRIAAVKIISYRRFLGQDMMGRSSIQLRCFTVKRSGNGKFPSLGGVDFLREAQKRRGRVPGAERGKTLMGYVHIE